MVIDVTGVQGQLVITLLYRHRVVVGPLKKKFKSRRFYLNSKFMENV